MHMTGTHLNILTVCYFINIFNTSAFQYLGFQYRKHFGVKIDAHFI